MSGRQISYDRCQKESLSFDNHVVLRVRPNHRKQMEVEVQTGRVGFKEGRRRVSMAVFLPNRGLLFFFKKNAILQGKKIYNLTTIMGQFACNPSRKR